MRETAHVPTPTRTQKHLIVGKHEFLFPSQSVQFLSGRSQRRILGRPPGIHDKWHLRFPRCNWQREPLSSHFSPWLLANLNHPNNWTLEAAITGSSLTPIDCSGFAGYCNIDWLGITRGGADGVWDSAHNASREPSSRWQWPSGCTPAVLLLARSIIKLIKTDTVLKFSIQKSFKSAQ